MGAPAGVPKIEHQARNAEGQSSPLQTVAVPEPARVMVRATRQGQQSQQQSWLQFSAAMYLMKRSQARARLAEKYWRMKQIRRQDHAGSANAASSGRRLQRQRVHSGLSAEEFTQQCSMWCLEEGKKGPCKMTGTCGDQAVVMLWQGPATVGTDKLARRVDRLARRRAWAPPDGVPSLGGESREEFLQGCNGWYMSDKGQDMPCRIIEPSCQGGQSALVRFWCKEKTVPWSKLTQVVDAEGHAVGCTEKQEQDKAQLDKLQGQEASAAATAFHAECDRHYASKAGTVTPCKMLSSKSGRSEVMFANGKASVCSAQLSWRQAPAAAKRSEQQAREQQARKQAAVEASATGAEAKGEAENSTVGAGVSSAGHRGRGQCSAA